MRNLVGLLAYSLLPLCFAPVVGAAPVAPALQHDLTAEQTLQLRAAALNGDAEASRRLADFALFIESHEEDYAFWLRLSAEQGNCDSLRRWLQWREHRATGGAGQATRSASLRKRSLSCRIE